MGLRDLALNKKNTVHVNADDLLKNVKTKKDASVLIVYGDHCPYCRALKRDLNTLSNRLEKESNKKLYLMDSNDRANDDFLKKFHKIQFVPQIFVICPKTLSVTKNQFSLGPLDGQGHRNVPIDQIYKELNRLSR